MNGWVAYMAIGALSNLLFVINFRRRGHYGPSDRGHRRRADWSDWLFALNIVTLIMWPFMLPELIADEWRLWRYVGRHRYGVNSNTLEPGAPLDHR